VAGCDLLATRGHFASRFVANAAGILVNFSDGGRMRAILFDFGGTLDGPSHWLDRFLTYYRASGLSLSRDELDSAYAYATQRTYDNSARFREYGLDRLVEYLVGAQLDCLLEKGPLKVRGMLGRSDARKSQIVEQISGGFVGETARGLERSGQVLRTLKSRFSLGVVSNFYGNLDHVLTDAGIAELFGVIADSTRLGFFKPDVRIFKEALRKLGVVPGDAVMVGDSLEKDCAPARSLGLKTVWVRSPGAHVRGDEAMADYQISTLDELERFEWQTV
jgi:FMN phosphatase YigB (HAD superfamily)